MLIPLNTVINEFGKPKGVIHVGAHTAEEAESYKKANISNVVWIEANEDLKSKIEGNPFTNGDKILIAAVSDIDDEEVMFNITNNMQSSSILPLKEHSNYYPDIVVSNKRVVKTKTIDTLFNENNINPSLYDFMNLDIQGAEFLALMGAKTCLNYVKYIYTEVNFKELYENCVLYDDLKDFLGARGFKPVKMVDTGAGWGDALFVKNI